MHCDLPSAVLKICKRTRAALSWSSFKSLRNLYHNLILTHLKSRDNTGMGTGTVPARTTSLRFGFGTFFVLAPDLAKHVRKIFSGKVYRISTVCYNWPMSAHASQAFSIVHCTDSEDLPFSV